MAQEYPPLSIRVWGGHACFTRPQRAHDRAQMQAAAARKRAGGQGAQDEALETEY